VIGRGNQLILVDNNIHYCTLLTFFHKEHCRCYIAAVLH